MKALYIILALIFSSAGFTQNQKPTKINPERKIHLKITEPSDICIHPNGNSLFIVSDDGYLFETDMDGNIIRKAEDYKGLDCEGVYADKDYVYVAEEFSRRIQVFNIHDFSIERTVRLEYNGARNSGYEAITFNEARNRFLLFTEKNPIYLFELDENLRKVNEIDLSDISRDISAATYHNNFLWLLGDEEMTIYKVNPNTYKVLKSWKIPVVNPEGLTFDHHGNMLILSDDMQLLYYFKNPEN